MEAYRSEQDLFGPQIGVLARSQDCAVYQVQSANGDGVMTSHRVFEGVQLIYGDFDMSSCFQRVPLCDDIMEINHCREGRYECEFENGDCAYLEEGDLAVNMCNHRMAGSTFPLDHYRGVTVIIRLSVADSALRHVLDDINIDLYALRDRLCRDNRCFIMRANQQIQHIFSELYTVPHDVRKGYFKLKILELLLFLSVVDPLEQNDCSRYFPRAQVERVKQVRAYISAHPEQRLTLAALSQQFGIALTSLKLCFKGVYGVPIASYAKTLRMQAAAVLLRQSGDSVMIIAGKVGYANASKFAAAFRGVMGFSPLDYRRADDSVKRANSRPIGAERAASE